MPRRRREPGAGHDLAAVITVPVTAKEASRLMNGERVVFRKVDPQSATVRDLFLACLTCERQFNDPRFQEPCAGEPSGYLEDGTPVWEDESA